MSDRHLCLEVDTVAELAGRPDVSEWVRGSFRALVEPHLARFDARLREHLFLEAEGRVGEAYVDEPFTEQGWLRLADRWNNGELEALAIGIEDVVEVAARLPDRPGCAGMLFVALHEAAFEPSITAEAQRAWVDWLLAAARRFDAATGYLGWGDGTWLSTPYETRHGLSWLRSLCDGVWVRGAFFGTLLGAAHVGALGGWEAVAGTAPVQHVAPVALSSGAGAFLRVSDNLYDADPAALAGLEAFLSPVLAPPSDTPPEETHPIEECELVVVAGADREPRVSRYVLTTDPELSDDRAARVVSALTAWHELASMTGRRTPIGLLHGPESRTGDQGERAMAWTIDWGQSDPATLDDLYATVKTLLSHLGIRSARLVAETVLSD